MTRLSFLQNERAASEALGFILIIAIISFGSVIGGVIGMEQLAQSTQGQPIQAAETGMTNVQSDLYDLSQGAPHRTTEVELTDGQLKYGNEVTITVEATSSNGTMNTQVIEYQPLIYDTGRAKLIVSGGAVFLQQGDGVVMKSEPKYRIDSEQAIIPLLNTTHQDGPSSLGVGGDGSLVIAAYNWETTTERFEPKDTDGNPLVASVTITIESPRTGEWAEYYREDSRFTDVTYDEATNTVSASFETKNVFVRTTEAHIRFDN